MRSTTETVQNESGATPMIQTENKVYYWECYEDDIVQILHHKVQSQDIIHIIII